MKEDTDEEKKEEVEEPVEEMVAEMEGDKWYEQIFRKTKEWFEAEPDSEF